MRLQESCAGLVCLLLAGCVPQIDLTSPEPEAAPETVVAGVTASNDELAAPAAELSADEPLSLSGLISVDGEYHLFALAGSSIGDEWEVSVSGARGGSVPLLVALFNADQELLQRHIVGSASPLRHLVRTDTSAVTVGVTLPYSGSGERFDLQVRRVAGAGAPGPRPQAVWLNFGGAADVSVHSRRGITLDAFNAERISGTYAGQTVAMKAVVVATIRADYAPYNVTVLTSDDGPAPDGPHATVHFGGSDARLLGLADSVDQYNEDLWQTAVIYVDGFSDFGPMRLTVQEMGQMIGNVASHEFGHLLGLFHTQEPADLMDTTGTAWDLVADQSFLSAALEPSVFPYGRENSPRRLGEIVGTRPAPPTGKRLAAPALQKLVIRAMAREAMKTRCGTCLHPDE